MVKIIFNLEIYVAHTTTLPGAQIHPKDQDRSFLSDTIVGLGSWIIAALAMGNRTSAFEEKVKFEETKKRKDERDPVQRKRNDQGNHEVEVFGPRPEATESACAWRECTKNAGHDNFIPAPEFSLNHLPYWHRDPSVMEHIKAISALTVRIRVTYTSEERPKGYSFYKDRGSDILHLGSGWIWAARPGKGPCPCLKCAGSSLRKKWFMIYSDTACHVVFNTQEALYTKVDIFYEDEASRVTGVMKTLQGHEVRHKDVEGDSCMLLCVTHDETLVADLQMHLNKCKTQGQHLHELEVVSEDNHTFRYSNLHKKKKDCKIVPDPIYWLCHPSYRCQGGSLPKCLRILDYLTVKLKVSYTSFERPNNYLHAGDKGSSVPRTGLGWIWSVQRGKGKCWCPECTRSSSPRKKWYEVHVDASCHIVFDSEEARSTRAKTFFKATKGKKEKPSSRVKELIGMEVLRRDLEGDACKLVCATHDKALAKQLKNYVDQMKSMLRTLMLQRRYLCLVISCPHGQAKHVTVGELRQTCLGGWNHWRLSYSADTCPGSSGAPVLVLDFERSRFNRKDSSAWLLAPHSQHAEGSRFHFNQSGVPRPKYC